MSETKLFEVRDKMTMVGVLAVQLSAADGYLARRCGYGAPCVILTRLQGGRSCYDAYDWADRTMTTAHNYIQERWSELRTGEVVDVEYILGETSTPKRSESEEEVPGVVERGVTGSARTILEGGQ